MFFAATFAIGGVAVSLADRMFGADRSRPFARIVGLGIVLAFAFLLARRTIRRTAGPVGDVMEAARRVAGGDYGARVDVRGPGDIRRLATAFNEMAERLETNEERRRRLMADVAHELRTPMTVIRGHAEGALDGVYEPDRAHLSRIVEETDLMARLLDDLQTLSMAEAGVLNLHRERADVGSLVDDALSAMQVRADAAGISLVRAMPDDLPHVDVDPVRIGQVLSNLVSNAVRYTPAGGTVTLGAERTEDGVALSVADTGSGIPSEELPHIFDRFAKSSDSGGSGLGLAIAKQLVEAHGGTISAASEPGHGTTMRVVLPLTPAIDHRAQRGRSGLPR
ncbi:MAG TPA: HAMP domain-containing sensor histidine kinase [Actinomycetota bacterium]|jgi:two-component system sensor histidine kinase BaeS|nr:HAMP domain-containing sensor histidine kinase [Actinomycetota bacterium]